MRVLVPVSERYGLDSGRANVSPLPWFGPALRIGFLGNSKPNVEPLFDSCRHALRKRGIRDVKIIDKGSSTIPAPADMLSQLMAECNLVVTAIAD